MRWRPLFFGVLLMLLASYLDNLRGPLMPVLTRVLHLSYTQVSWFLVAGFVAAIAFTFGMRALTGRHSDRKVTAVVLVTSIVSVAFSAVVSGLGGLVALGALLGGGISGLGSVANLLVLESASDHHKARLMCFLHSMYGLGSLLAPAMLGLSMGEGDRWQVPLLGVLPILGLLLLGSGALGKQVHGEEKARVRPLTGLQWLAVFVVAAYVAGEVLISTWMVPYLVEAKGLALGEATSYASYFFLMMGVSRLLGVALLRPRWEVGFLFGGLVVAMGFFLLGRTGPLWALSLAGVFGPFFPVFFARLGKAFPGEERSVILMVIAVMQLTLALLHLLVGRLTDVVGIGTAYWLPLGFLLIALVGLVIYTGRERALLSSR